MRTGEHYAGGLTLNLFPSFEFETVNTNDSEVNDHVFARNLLRTLMCCSTSNWTNLVSWKTIYAVFLKRDHQMTKALRLAFQQGFDFLYEQLSQSSYTQLQHNQAQLYISNCLMYLPFADITPYESFSIPQLIDGRWEKIDYKVVPIELTPTSGLESLFIEDCDRVFCYGLEPIIQSSAQPHLIFMGTTYPAGQGFITSINTDMEAFETAGKKLYRSGRENITRWLDNQHQKVHVCGTSLGGSLSLLLAINQGQKLSRVDVLNPPGLHRTWLRKSRLDHWDKLVEKPEVYIQRQRNDPVSRFGVWKADWHVVHVLPTAAISARLNTFTDHALNYAGLKDTQFIEIDAVEDNKERAARTLWMYTLLRTGVYYGALAPFRYMLLPFLRLLAKNKTQLALILPFLLMGALFPILAVTLWPNIQAIIVAPCLIFLAYKMVNFFYHVFGFKQQVAAECHHPELPRNQSMDIYKTRGETEFTYEQIHNFYYAKRCILQGKEHIPSLTNSKTFFSSATGNKSKQHVLVESQQSAMKFERITCHASKAKLHEMKTTLNLIEKFGLNSARLKSELTLNRQAYLQGKVKCST